MVIYYKIIKSLDRNYKFVVFLKSQTIRLELVLAYRLPLTLEEMD